VNNSFRVTRKCRVMTETIRRRYKRDYPRGSVSRRPAVVYWNERGSRATTFIQFSAQIRDGVDPVGISGRDDRITRFVRT